MINGKRYTSNPDESELEATHRYLKQLIKESVKEALDEYFKEHPINTIAQQADEEWLSTEVAKKLLGIKSKSKLQKLRDAGEIVFSKHGRIIKYSRTSIEQFLRRNVKGSVASVLRKIA